MALELLYNGVQVDTVDRRATGRFHFGDVSDLPTRGAAASSWVETPESDPIGDEWYVDSLQVDESTEHICTIVARQPGWNWTWVGLKPIEKRKIYEISAGGKFVDGVAQYGFWFWFSNWADADNWGKDGAIPTAMQFLTWEIEWVSATRYASWNRKVNGEWPAGLTPPTAGAGVYWCKASEVETEPWVDPISGTETIYFRHFLTFWEAPSAPTPGTLTWRWPQW